MACSGTKMNRSVNSVRVTNISPHASQQEIVALFSSLVGDIRCVQECKDASTSDGYLQISFNSNDAASKALCMTGYTVCGASLTVTPVILPPVKSSPNPSIDDRRNLYVLGLPFALSKTEFASLFSQFGTVMHCVILATVDNSSRRRGFVVMCSHQEAVQAMAGLTRMQIKGHVIDVSWAVVQRSQGFLDGGDRSLLLDARSSRKSSPDPKQPMVQQPVDNAYPSDSSDSSLGSIELAPSSFTASAIPMAYLLVSNLPTILFSNVQDLHPLFYPFGEIKRMEAIEQSASECLKVIVQYASVEIAQEAKESLHGQYYAGHLIDAVYGQPVTQSLGFQISTAGYMEDTAEYVDGRSPGQISCGNPLPYGSGPPGSCYDNRNFNPFDCQSSFDPHSGVDKQFINSYATHLPFSPAFYDQSAYRSHFYNSSWKLNGYSLYRPALGQYASPNQMNYDASIAFKDFTA